MKKQISTILLLALSVGVFAQEFKLPKTSGKLLISEVNNVTIEGYDGKEIIFSSMDGVKEKDPRAQGLRAINAMGIEDNTGIGLSVQDKGNTVEVYQMKKMVGPKVKIMVPKGVSVSYSHSSPYGSNIKFKNISNEIEVSTVHNSVHLDNVTGPLAVKTVHGSIDVIFGNTINNPISIVSVHGAVDVTLPVSAKANLSMTTSYGEMFVDPFIKIELDDQGEWKKYGSNRVNGKLNGGGLDMKLSSTHNNIYLRKK